MNMTDIAFRHIFLATFKVDAPVGQLVSGYAGLTEKIPAMKAFTYGELDK